MINVALYHPQIPQNTGTLLRLASCLGFTIDLIRPFGFIFDDKKLKRAGMDYISTANYRIHNSFDEFLETYQRDVGSDNASLLSESYASTISKDEANQAPPVMQQPGVLCGIFCSGYGIARFIGEFFREPDSSFSYELLFRTGMNLNQYMSIGIFFFGILLIYKVSNNHERA